MRILQDDIFMSAGMIVMSSNFAVNGTRRLKRLKFLLKYKFMKKLPNLLVVEDPLHHEQHEEEKICKRIPQIRL